MTRRFAFYIAWMAFSDGAGGVDTKVNTPDDLIPQFDAGNEHVTRYLYDCDPDYAYEVGISKAFRDNFTGHDTVTDMEVVE